MHCLHGFQLELVFESLVTKVREGRATSGNSELCLQVTFSVKEVLEAARICLGLFGRS